MKEEGGILFDIVEAKLALLFLFLKGLLSKPSTYGNIFYYGLLVMCPPHPPLDCIALLRICPIAVCGLLSRTARREDKLKFVPTIVVANLDVLFLFAIAV